MIEIDRLKLTLPAGFEGREGAVARRVAEALADLSLSVRTQPGTGRLDRLVVPPLSLDPALGDGQVARRIAGAIHDRLSAGGGDEP